MNKFLASVSYALQGIVYTVVHERNIKIQLAMFFLVLIMGSVMGISRCQWLSILSISALVLSLELVNTASERLIDKIAPYHDKELGIVKDILAGAVLVASLFALGIAMIIFWPPLVKIF